MKYIKWICLITGIIGIIVLGIIFISDNKTKEEKVFDINDLYNTAWYKRGIVYYENDELFSENLNMDDPRYMIFYEKYVEYHNPLTEEKDTYDYTYDKKTKTITINSEDYLLVKGTYNITLENNSLKLSQTTDENSYIYYFQSSEG